MSAATSCAPCVFGAVSSTLLSAPYSIVESVQVQIIPVVQTGINGSVFTSFSTTSFTAPGPAGAPTSRPGTVTVGAPTVDFDAGAVTWSTLGTVLTWPTTYVEYLGFEGAAATAPSVCAQTLSPTTLFLNAAPSNLIYASNDTSAGLPGGLLSFLDGLGFPDQLNGNQLESCPPLGAPAPASAPTTSSAPATSSVITLVSSSEASSSASAPNSTITLSPTSNSISLVTESASVSTLTTSATILTSSVVTTTAVSTSLTPPPPSTITTAVESTVLVSSTVASVATVTYTPARVFGTVTGPPIVISSGTTSTLSPPPTPLAVSEASSSSTSTISSQSPSLNPLFSAIASLASYAASSSAGVTTTTETTTVTSSSIIYTSSSSSSSSESLTTITAIYTNGTLSGSSTIAVAPVTAFPSGVLPNATVVANPSSTYTAYYTGNAPKGSDPQSLGLLGALLGLLMLW